MEIYVYVSPLSKLIIVKVCISESKILLSVKFSDQPVETNLFNLISSINYLLLKRLIFSGVQFGYFFVGDIITYLLLRLLLYPTNQLQIRIFHRLLNHSSKQFSKHPFRCRFCILGILHNSPSSKSIGKGENEK